MSWSRFVAVVSWVTCPFGAPHGPRPSHRAWTQNGPQTRMRHTQIGHKAHRRYTDGSRRGWGLLGRNPGGSVRASGHVAKRGARPPQTMSAPQLRRTEAQLLAAKSSAGMKEPSTRLAGPRRPLPRARGSRGRNRHIRPRLTAAICWFWDMVRAKGVYCRPVGACVCVWGGGVVHGVTCRRAGGAISNPTHPLVPSQPQSAFIAKPQTCPLPPVLLVFYRSSLCSFFKTYAPSSSYASSSYAPSSSSIWLC
jgi:hypothetical protein